MGGYSYGNLHYNYKIKIDLEDLVDRILDKIGVSGEDWYFDDTSLVIDGSDKCRFKHWHCDATLYDPAEDDTELIDSIDDKDIEKAISEALDEFKKYIDHKCISEVEIDEDSYEYEDDGPDEDAIYDEWKDRQLEGWE